MDEPTVPHGTLSPSALEQLGEMLRGRYHLPATLPSRVYDLMMKLNRCNGGVDQPEEPDQRAGMGSPSTTFDELTPASKENDYRRQAVETMRLAQQASSAFARARLVNLAEAWVDLAERAHRARHSFRS